MKQRNELPAERADAEQFGIAPPEVPAHYAWTLTIVAWVISIIAVAAVALWA